MRILCCPSGNRKGQKGETGREEKKKRENGAQSCRSRGSDTFLEDDDDGPEQSEMKKEEIRKRRG